MMRSMRKRVQLTLAVLAFALFGLVAWQESYRKDPVYQGRRLSGWLADLDLESPGPPEPAIQAVRAIGTNAFPRLLEMLRAKDPFWRRALIAFDARQSFLQIRVSPASLTRDRAVEGYGALGPAAKESVSALIQVMESDASVEVRSDTASALGAIGPEAKPAIPTLWKAVQNGNPELRKRALLALSNIYRWDQSSPFGF